MYATINEGEIEGARLRASLAAPGRDGWAGAVTDIFDLTCVWRFVQTMGEALLVRCSGLIEQTPAFMKATKENGATGWDDQHIRLVMRFDIGAEHYRGLNTSLFIAKGRLVRGGNLDERSFA
jgi:hypothetical protein